MNERWKEAAISSSSASGSCDGPASRSSAKRGSVSAAAPKQQSTPGRTTSHVESESAAATSAASLTPPTDQKVTASIAHALATKAWPTGCERDACIAQKRSTMPACTRPRSMHSPEMSSCALPANVVVAEHTNAIASAGSCVRLSESHSRNFRRRSRVSSSASSARTPRPAASTPSRP